MTRFGHFLLAATSAALITFICGVVLVVWEAPSERFGANSWALSLIAISFILVVLCALMLSGLRRIAPARKEIDPSKTKQLKQRPLEFLFGHAVPVVLAWGDPSDLLTASIIFSSSIVLLVWGFNASHINPTLGILGYRFHRVVTPDGRVLVLSRRKYLAKAMKVDVIVVNDRLWLEATDPPRNTTSRSIDDECYGIGGSDRVFSGDAREAALLCLRAAWPNAITEDGDTDIGEIFVYRDSAAREAWRRDGGTVENQNTMIHILGTDESTTIVTD